MTEDEELALVEKLSRKTHDIFNGNPISVCMMVVAEIIAYSIHVGDPAPDVDAVMKIIRDMVIAQLNEWDQSLN